MPIACPVCDLPLPADAPACAGCGFPAGLAEEAAKALAEPAPSAEAPRPASAEAPAPPAVDPQAVLCDRIARDVDRELVTLTELGGDGLAVSSDLRQAALVQADDRVVEALGILRQAHARLGQEIDRLFAARIAEIETRAERLHGAGLAIVIGPELASLQEEATRPERTAAIQRLRGLDDRLLRVEGEWNGLKGLFAQVDLLKEELGRFGTVPPEIDADIARCRALVATTDVTPQLLDEASQIAARALMLLHEGLAPHLEEELNRTAVALQAWPDDHAPSRRAKSLHADAVKHLRRGSLSDASSRLRELRAAVEELRRAHPPAPHAAPAPAAGPAGTDRALEALLAKARGLAARVRGLPAESDLAYEAASEIRRATELLRARKLEEADQTLSRLMQTLAAEPPRGRGAA